MLVLLLLLFVVAYNLNSQEIKWNNIQNITILNSEFDEFAPSWNKYENILYFNSTRDGYSKFYSCSINNGKFSQAKLVEGDINIPRNNQSYISFESPDKAYLSTFRMYDGIPYSNIFQTFKKRGKWLLPIEVDSLQMKTFCSQATISPDGKSLIFVTDANSLYGDTDLWMAFKQENGTWGGFIKLSNLCSPGNEITPFFASNDTLFFASDGQAGPGGFDIFISVKDQGIWQNPFPVEEINTEFNESDFCVLASGNEAVFASDRPGGLGGLDLYYTQKTMVYPDYIAPEFQYQFATQVPVIKVIATGKKNYQYINNNFIYDKILFEQNLKNLPSEYEFIYKFYNEQFELISSEIKQLNEKVICKIFSDKKVDNVILSSILNKLNLDTNQIQFVLEKLPEKIRDRFGNDFIYFNLYSESNIFGLQNHFKADSIELQPPILQVILLVEPISLVNNLKCNINCNGNLDTTFYNSSVNPAQFLIDLRQFKKSLLKADSLNFIIENTDTSGRKFYHNESMPISHNIISYDSVVSSKKNSTIFYYNLIDDESLNKLINELSNISKNGYNNFKLMVYSEDLNSDYIIKIRENFENLSIQNKTITTKLKELKLKLPDKIRETLIMLEIHFN